MKKAKAIQICGTGSGVGKSIMVSGLCRILLEDGHSPAPFKAQNMALNSFVTEDGGEMGRAQVVQAWACKLKPAVDMNPILIKPTSNTAAQIILHGKPVRNMSVYGYKDYKKYAFDKVKESFRRLAGEYETIVIEGAGSPAEINLRNQDIVNLKMAKYARAPVILVGDIDKGGVFASLIGTLQLLTEDERRHVKGFIINKFRGDKRLLRSGLTFLEKYTGLKVLGVVPYFKDIKIPEEDSVSVETPREDRPSRKKIEIRVIYLPHISNFTDFDALEREPDVHLKYIGRPEELDRADVMIIPGTKNTIADLNYLKKSGLAEAVVSLFRKSSCMLAGICGGYQVLGESVFDRTGTESKTGGTKGLGILPMVTEIRPEKILAQVRAMHIASGAEVVGYEIHHGQAKITGDMKPLFKISRPGSRNAARYDGIITGDGRCWGTYIHGIFDNDGYRRYFLNDVRKKKGWPALPAGARYDVDREITKLAALLRKNLDMDLWYDILNKGVAF